MQTSRLSVIAQVHLFKGAVASSCDVNSIKISLLYTEEN